MTNFTEKEKQMLLTAKQRIFQYGKDYNVFVDDDCFDYSDCSNDEEKKQKRQEYINKGFYDIVCNLYDLKEITNNFSQTINSLPDFLREITYK